MASLKKVTTLMSDGDWVESKDQSVEGIRLVQTGNIGEGEYLDKSKNAKYISDETFVRLNCTEVFEGDVLVSRLPAPVGRACILPKCSTRMITAVDCTIMRFDKEQCIPSFFVYFSMSSNYQFQVTKHLAGSTRVRISRKNLETVVIPLPPLENQRQISKMLDTAAELLAMRKQQLAELDNLIKSTFYDMFGDPVRNDKGWGIVKLMDITTKIGSGATPKGGKESYQDEGVSLIRSMNVHNGVFKYEQLAHINDEQAKQLNIVTVKENDVLINITGASVARSCIVPNDVLPARVNQHVSIVRIEEEKATSEYINNMFINNSFQTQLLSIGGAGGATREAINKQQLQELVFPLPPISLQHQFAAIVTKIEDQKTLVKKAIDETQYLFDSLMSEYFE
jgi:type I restriction enzyme S subunit